MQNDDQLPRQHRDDKQESKPQPLQDAVPLPQISTQIYVPEKKRSKKVIAMIIFVTLIVMGIGGYFAYTYFFPGKEAQSATMNPSLQEWSPQSSERPDVAGIVSSIKSKLSGEEYTFSKEYDVPMVAHKTSPGYWVLLAQGEEGAKIEHFSRKYANFQENRTDFALVKKELTDRGIKKVLDTSDLSDEAGSYEGRYASSTIDCYLWNGFGGVQYSTSEDDNSRTWSNLKLSCASATDFTARIAEVEPIAKALKAGSKKPVTEALIMDMRITKSVEKGYAYATVSMSDAVRDDEYQMALLYQVPNGSWYYFRNVQASLACSEFNTADVKKAFVGYWCTDGATTRKVTAS